jgi:hypothetical protein
MAPDLKQTRPRLLGRWGAFGWAVAGVAGVAVSLRVVLMIAYTPAILYYPDERSYVAAAAGKLFSNAYRPAGYSVFLRLVHLFSANLAVTVAVQHLLGLAGALVAYAIARRVGAGRWFALAAAAIIVLSGDQLYLEHIVLSDGLFLTVLLLVCYCALRARGAAHTETRVQIAWAVAVGVLAGALVTVRTIGLPVAGVVVVWLALAGGSGWRRRLMAAGAAAMMCGALLLAYAFGQQAETHDFGLSRFSGWPLYGRVAPFADCSQFKPPAGTAGLCQTTPPGARSGPAFYLWNTDSPAHRLFGAGPPGNGGQLGAFARAAILAQPGDYLLAVLRDLARYVDPDLLRSGSWGGGPGAVSLNYRQPLTEAVNVQAIRPYYGPVTVRVRHHIVDALTTWQGIVRAHGWMIGLAGLLALAGILYAPDPDTRAGLALLLASALAILVVSAMVSEYSYRYGIPPAALLMVAGARGAEVILTRVRLREPALHPL